MKKLFPIILLLFGMVSIFTIPTIEEKNTLRTNLEIEKEEIEGEDILYLLDPNNYYVEVKINLPKDKIINTIESLKETTKEDSYHGYLPKNIEVLDYEIKEKVLKLNLSMDFDEKYIPGLIHSLLARKEFTKVELKIKGEWKKGYEYELDDSLPLNKVVDVTRRIETDKVVIYYVEDREKNDLVPVTKYKNSKEEKIKVILEELKTNIPDNLVSYISSNLELLDYELDKDCLILNFNKELLKDNKRRNIILEELSRTIFKNYDVTSILLKIDGKLEEIIQKD